MAHELKIGLISAFSGVLGGVAGALASGYFAFQVANIQLKQAVMSTTAASALSVRSTLAEKAASFFEANQKFLTELRVESDNQTKLRDSLADLDKARANLSPYIDADLLASCDALAISARMISAARNRKESDDAYDAYTAAYGQFTTLYLRLRRSLEEKAQLNLLDAQIADQYKK